MKALIIDDEKLAGENLKVLIEKYCAEIDQITVVNHVIPALDILKHTPPDILFLDIHLNETDGFKLLEAVPNRAFHIIMVSADDSHGLKAIKEEVVDYILKPIDIIDLKKAVSKVSQKLKKDKSTSNDKISVPSQHGNRLISPEDIVRVEAQSNYSKIFCTDSSTILVSKPLKSLEESLLDSGFFRVHKSHLVKLNAIKSYSKANFEITLFDGKVLPLSRRNITEFVEQIKTITRGF